MSLLLANGRDKLKHRDLPVLWFLTDEARTGDAFGVLMSLPRGAGVIFRHYGAHDRAALARRLAKLSRTRGLVFLVADDWRLAAAIGAAGVHLPEHVAARGPASGARLWRRQRKTLLTVAAHGSHGLARARALDADAALLAPVFPTQSHPDRVALGLVRAAALVRRARLPVLALGGASPDKLPHVGAAGFAGIAGIGFLLERKI
jgi:thiamine-phosphate pyrophosphorylase